MRSRGSTATASTMMPMPPSQWLNWRQKTIERSSASMSVSTVAPVAVKPETDSKKASIGFASCDRPPSRYGSIPNTGTSSQISPTTRKPSRGPTAAPRLGTGDLVEQHGRRRR